jgi:hypothetical protein
MSLNRLLPSSLVFTTINLLLVTSVFSSDLGTMPYPVDLQKDVCSTEEFTQKLCFSKRVLKDGEMNDSSLIASCRRTLEKDPNVYARNFEEEIKILTQAFELAPRWFKMQLCALGGVVIHNLPKDEAQVNSWSANSPRHFVGLPLAHLKPGAYSLHNIGNLLTADKKVADRDLVAKGYGFEDIDKNFKDSTQALAILSDMGHEMGHEIYDVDNRKVKSKFLGSASCKDDGTCTPFKDGQWGAISWHSVSPPIGVFGEFGLYFGVIRPENQKIWDMTNPNSESYKNRTSSPTSKETDVFFKELFGQGFVSSFAVASPVEDFCETLSWKLMAELIPSWKFKFSDGTKFDAMVEFRNPKNPILKKKMEFVDSILGL